MESQMNIFSFSDLRKCLYSFYLQGDFEHGLSTLDTHARRFPNEENLSIYWRVCFLSRLNRQQEALNQLEVALNAGYWWAKDTLLRDGDLLSLQELPAFLDLLEKFSAVEARERAAAHPGCISALPDTPPPANGYPLLVALHGRGGAGDLFFDLWKQAAQFGWLVIMPSSSQVIGYRIHCWDDKALAAAEINTHIEKIRSEYPIDPEKMVIGGFSQGGGLAFELAVGGKLGISRFISTVPALFQLEDTPQAVSLRGVILAGEKDARWAAHAPRMADWLTAHGADCRLSMYPDCGHEFPPDFSECLPQYLNWLTR